MTVFYHTNIYNRVSLISSLTCQPSKGILIRLRFKGFSCENIDVCSPWEQCFDLKILNVVVCWMFYTGRVNLWVSHHTKGGNTLDSRLKLNYGFWHCIYRKCIIKIALWHSSSTDIHNTWVHVSTRVAITASCILW